MNDRVFRWVFLIFHFSLAIAIFIEKAEKWLKAVQTPAENPLGNFLPWFVGAEAVIALLFVIPKYKRILGCLLLAFIAISFLIFHDTNKLALCLYMAGIILVVVANDNTKLTLESIAKQHTPLVVCSLIASALLIIFLGLQNYNPEILKLPTTWLIAAGTPILIGLIIGSYIKSFKGFGVELESLLELPVNEIKLLASDAAEATKSMEKGSVDFLRNLDHGEKVKIKRLAFITGTSSYSSGDVSEYLKELPNLEYFEIKDQNKRFQALVPVSYFKDAGNGNTTRVSNFVTAVEMNTLPDLLGKMITETVPENLSLFDVLRKSRNSLFGTLAVIDSNQQLIGIVTDKLVEKRIADEVISLQRRNTKS